MLEAFLIEWIGPHLYGSFLAVAAIFACVGFLFWSATRF